MSGIKPYKGIKLSGTPPTDPKDKINTYNFKVLAKNVKEISNTYVSSSDVTQIIEGDKIFNNLYVTGISAGNVLTVDTCGKIIDSGISVADLISAGPSVTLIAGTNVSIVESPDNTYTISVSGELSTNLVDLNDVNISSPVDGQFLIYDSATSKWINSSLAFSLNGSIDLNTVDQTYTINHSYIETSVPVVSLVIPVSGDTLFVTGISEIGNTSFRVSLSSVPSVSGYKLNYILATDSTTYTSSSEVASISAYLQNQINNKVDNIIGGTGISVVELPTNTYTLNITGNYATSSTVSGISAYLQNQINTIPLSAYTLRTETAAVSGYLNNRINNITSENTVVRGGSGISVVQSPTQTFTVSVSGNYITSTDVAAISSSLDNRLDIIEATYITEVEVAGISGYLQTQITNISAGVSNVNIVGGSGIQVVESPADNFVISITGSYVTTSTVSNITADLNNRLTVIENTYITDSEVAGISGYLQNQISTIPLSAYTLRTETAAVSGYLNNRINGITGENTVVLGGSGISVVQSPTQTFTVSVSGNYATTSQVTAASANAYNQSVAYVLGRNYTTRTETAAVSAYLQSQISGITGGGSSTLDGLIDVVLTNPVSGEVLFYDGIKWINRDISSISGISGSAGGDLDGFYPDPVVVQVHGRNKTLTYDGNNNLVYLVDEYGAKSFSYDINGLLVSISGSGRYQSKSFTYDGNDNLIGITII